MNLDHKYGRIKMPWSVVTMWVIALIIWGYLTCSCVIGTITLCSKIHPLPQDKNEPESGCEFQGFGELKANPKIFIEPEKPQPIIPKRMKRWDTL